MWGCGSSQDRCTICPGNCCLSFLHWHKFGSQSVAQHYRSGQGPKTQMLQVRASDAWRLTTTAWCVWVLIKQQHYKSRRCIDAYQYKAQQAAQTTLQYSYLLHQLHLHSACATHLLLGLFCGQFTPWVAVCVASACPCVV